MKRIQVPSKSTGIFFPSLPEATFAAILSEQWIKQKSKILIVVSDSLTDAEILCEDIASLTQLHCSKKLSLELYLLEEDPVLSNPDSFDKSCSKLSLLSALMELEHSENQRIIIASTPDGILAPCCPKEEKAKTQISIHKGMTLDFSSFQKQLHDQLDYSSEIVCEEPGQYALRGGLVDIYPVNTNQPYRVDFFGDEIDDIRVFDPTSQRTIKSVKEVTLSSAKPENECFQEGAFLSYLEASTIWAFIEPEKLISNYPLAFHQSAETKLKKADFSLIWNRKKSLNYYIGLSGINAGKGILEKINEVQLSVSASSQILNPEQNNFFTADEGRYRKSYLFELLNKQDAGNKVIISAGANAEKKRILELIKNESSLERLNPEFIQIGLRDGFTIVAKDAGNFLPHLQSDKKCGVSLATAREILGRERSRRPLRSQKARVLRKNVDQALDFSELISGDFLVHHQHGICRFDNLGKIENDGSVEETITVEFADGLMLHVPLQESHLLSRYIGLQKAKPKLARLGGKLWAKTKQAAETAAMI